MGDEDLYDTRGFDMHEEDEIYEDLVYRRMKMASGQTTPKAKVYTTLPRRIQSMYSFVTNI